jgi:PAS domain S-box-containing protein
MEKFKILIIDDIKQNIFALTTVLEKNINFEIKGISSAIEALSYIDHQTVDLILCDVQMPNMDGFEFVSIIRLRKKTAGIPVMFVSAHHKEEAFFKRAKDLGTIDYLVKPIDEDELLHRLNTYYTFALREHEKTKELAVLNSKLLVNKLFSQSLEKKVKERTRELNSILSLSPDGFVLESVDNNIIYINPALLNMTGFTEDKFIGRSAQVFSDAMATLYNSELMEYTNIIGTEDCEHTIYLSSPTERVINCKQRTMHGLMGAKEGQILYFRDVTHETEVDKMKSDFLSTAAHELRTPLASIFGFSELLMNRDYDKKMSYDIFETIHRQSLNLKKLLDELLDLSRIEARAGKDFYMGNHSLKELVQQSCLEAEGAFKGRKVDVRSSECWPTISCDIDKMRQVFNNLLSNGFKYSPENENVLLKTSERQHNGIKQFGVSIVDKGIGMTPTQLARIGERFYRADDSGATPGTGLGVSLVKEIVSIHAGDVEFASDNGKGMVVTVWLPIVKELNA